MKSMWLQHKNKFITAGVVLVLLAIAFFWGGSPKGSIETKIPQSSAVTGSQSGSQAPAPSVNPVSAPQAVKNTSGAGTTGQTKVPSVQEPSPAAATDNNPAVNSEPACTLSVKCTTILDHMDKFDKSKLQVLPSDGVIFPAAKVSFAQGESVFDVLQREMKKAAIQFEFNDVPVYQSKYIEGIDNIYELDCGELSGWVYKVNGTVPGYGCSLCKLKDGDVVEVVYTCNLGRDVGGNNFQGE
jgi:hypothetical protein